ncbi:MAG: putative transcriptional regulator [Ferruginibacter sp.]|nr:putative transcriptional regulator [Ferruginibacter sp.]
MQVNVILDIMMVRRKMSLNELCEKVDITLSTLSILKTGKATGIRFTTLAAICKALNCEITDILELDKTDETFAEVAWTEP